MEPLKVQIHSIFSHLSLKDKPIMGYSAATEHEMEAFFSILQDVEPDITKEDKAKECLSRRPKLKEFLQHCCHERKYVFGVKKCGKSDCKICQAPRLPEPVFNQVHHIPDPIPENEQHYKPFLNLYGTLATETGLR